MNIELLKSLIGEVDPEQLRNIDCFINEKFGIFLPVSGPCYYAQQPMHTHPAYMVVITSDEFSKVQLGDQVIRSIAGKMLIMSPEVEHTELSSDEIPRYICLLFRKDFFENILLSYYSKSVPYIEYSFYNVPQELIGLARKFMNEYVNKRTGWEGILELLATEMAHSVIRQIYQIEMNHSKQDFRIDVNRLIEYLYQNITEPISIDDLVQNSTMSKAHLIRVFKKETGIPPMEYLNNIRLEKAKKLLLVGELTISETAMECGFNSQTYFSSSFKKKFNSTPSSYAQTVK